jgi:hypothetical protein
MKNFWWIFASALVFKSEAYPFLMLDTDCQNHNPEKNTLQILPCDEFLEECVKFSKKKYDNMLSDNIMLQVSDNIQ